MSDGTSYSDLHRLLLHLPILTTFLAAFFCLTLFSRLKRKGGGLHLLWWGIGMATYGIGTFTEAYTTLFGWDPTVFRAWYVAGAFLGGYPLAQGSIYLLANRRFAHASAALVSGLIAVASVFVFLTPLNVSLAEAHRLSGQVIEWRWIRFISPFFNLYAVTFLVGGAVVSALRFRRTPALRHRYVGNILIALGAILPGIGGAMTRAGYVEVLYVTELAGLLLIFTGYRKCVAAPSPAAVRVPARVPQALALALLLALGGAAAATAEDPAAPAPAPAPEPAAAADDAAETAPELSFFATTTVTATGSEIDTLEVATPVTVISAEEIERRAPANASDLLRTEPGVDVNGIGPNQTRPIIRGQRGLRVLFLENGLRMNNPRRQTDFGEITGLTDINGVERVEVVRGPASVLYGSDAIGGVLNLITRGATFRDGNALGGSLALGYGSAGEAERAHATFDGRGDRVSFHLGASYRDAADYEAPSGSYGDIRLDGDVPVVDSGVQDESLYGSLAFQASERHSLSLRLSRYSADQSGFGFVEPAVLGSDESFRIRILYPFQDFDRYTFGYLGSNLGSAVADSVDAQLYYQNNERQLANDIDIDIGPIFRGAPNSTVEADTLNFTDLETLGLRAEVVKLAGERHFLTYGLELYEDESFNTDFSTTVTTLRFPFPPFAVVDTQTDAVANAPNATNTSTGLFVQDEIDLGERFKLTLGARYQKVETRAEPTPDWDTAGLDFEDDAVVGAVNLLYRATDYLNVVGSYGTAFRAPNIIERLFNGPTPEGAGYQILNPDLTSEESENFDLGLKYRRRNAFFEAIFFRNDIDDGIVQHFLTGDEIARLPQEVRDAIDALGMVFVVQQRNIERLRYEGVELTVGWHAENGFEVGGNYTHLDAERFDSTNPPTGDTFGDKYNLYARYRRPGGRFWVEYRLRHNEDDRANLDPGEPLPPVGDVLPAFTVHTLAGGARLFNWGRQEHSLSVVLDNLTDELYAEFSNATFFRPQPKRNLTATYRIRF